MQSENSNLIQWADFEKIEIRTGTILSAEIFKQARKPAYKLKIDFGESGIKQSSAQLTVLYKVEELAGRQIVAIINFPKKQIANFFSECLVLGVLGENSAVTLLVPDKMVPNGLRIA